MRIYSRTSVSFIKRCIPLAQKIMATEANFPFKGKRFVYKNYTYPINLVCFEDERKGEIRGLGYFKWQNYEVGLNKCLMYRAGEEFIANILRHELGHYICYLHHGDGVFDHGPEYRQICRQFGWGKEVFNAKATAEEIEESVQENEVEKKVLQKVQKLLALGSSGNSHEAEMATIKANELLIKHNLTKNSLSQKEEEEFVIKVVASAKRSNMLIQSLSVILENFFVRTVVNHGSAGVALEVFGTKINVELADYVAKFLLYEFDRLWSVAKKNNPRLKGLASKNSFLVGATKALDKKIKSSQNNGERGQELVLLQSSLDQGMALAYPRLSKGRGRTSRRCTEGYSLGQKAGKNIAINPAVKQKSTYIQMLTL